MLLPTPGFLTWSAEISALAGYMLLQDPRRELPPDLCAWKQSCILHWATPQDSVPTSQAGLSPSHLSAHRPFRILRLSISSACELRGSLVPSVIYVHIQDLVGIQGPSVELNWAGKDWIGLERSLSTISVADLRSNSKFSALNSGPFPTPQLADTLGSGHLWGDPE